LSLKKALIIGITGQDGSYLAEFLLDRGYEVIGISRRSNTSDFDRIKHIQSQISIETADPLDQSSLNSALESIQPDEVYNLGGQSFIGFSWQEPVLDAETTGLGVARILEAIRHHCPHSRFYQSSSSEMFGDALEVPQNENTPFNPRSPYGLSKMYGHWITRLYRKQYGLFTLSGILYNHESPRRRMEFVTRKITNGAARIKLGLDDELRLGNPEYRRDWGFAGDYVRAMFLMLQQEEPEDFVIATGETHSVRELCEMAFGYLGLEYRDYVVEDPLFFRPAEEKLLVGDSSLARRKLNWEPETNFIELVQMMADSDCLTLSAKL
jgi:GDPmannose 4,6-dehydratase